jgi:betaine reductase
VAQRYRPDEVVVLLGTPTPDSSRLYAMTVTSGDPSWAGALAGVALGLPVYHVTEEPVRAQVPPADWEEYVALMAMAMDTPAIGAAVAAVRDAGGAPPAP